MINITYDRNANQNKVELANFNCLKKDEFPLTVEFVKTIGGIVSWTTELISGTWAVWNGGETIHDVLIKNAKGETVKTWQFNVDQDGDHIEKTLYHFLLHLDHRPNGLVIGSHDGTFGHWTYPVYEGLSDVVLVDGSAPQFEEVKKNYDHVIGVKFINTIVTTDGADVDWMMGGSGFTDTIYKPVINIFLEDSQITTTKRQSICVNDLIASIDGELDWLHLDVEGIDGDLILALTHRPTVIIFETMHIKHPQMLELLDWFQDNDYKMINDGSNAIAIKKSY